jgi:hypothetical protein
MPLPAPRPISSQKLRAISNFACTEIFDLGECEQVLETCFARDFLQQEPHHFVAGGGGGKPGKQRIALTRSRFLQSLEPGYEAVNIARNTGGQWRDGPPQSFNESDFGFGDRYLPRYLPIGRFVG